MKDECKCCGKTSDLRMGTCFDCASFESLIATKLDMYDKKIDRKIEGSESLNILHSIIKHYGKKK